MKSKWENVCSSLLWNDIFVSWVSNILPETISIITIFISQTGCRENPLCSMTAGILEKWKSIKVKSFLTVLVKNEWSFQSFDMATICISILSLFINQMKISIACSQRLLRRKNIPICIKFFPFFPYSNLYQIFPISD